MTVEDVKKELCRIDESIQIAACSMFRLPDDENDLEDKNKWVSLLDEEKLGLGSPDWRFSIQNTPEEDE